MNKSTCDVCAPLKQGWLADEGTIPAGVRHAQDSTVRLASWAADARAFRICSHCGTAWDLHKLPREGYWEAIDLPAAVRSLLGEGSPRRASRLFTWRRFAGALECTPVAAGARRALTGQRASGRCAARRSGRRQAARRVAGAAGPGPWQGWDRTPDALIVRLGHTWTATHPWVSQAQPGSAAFALVKDLKALLLNELRNDRVSNAMLAQIFDAVDPQAALLLEPSKACGHSQGHQSRPDCQCASEPDPTPARCQAILSACCLARVRMWCLYLWAAHGFPLNPTTAWPSASTAAPSFGAMQRPPRQRPPCGACARARAAWSTRGRWSVLS